MSDIQEIITSLRAFRDERDWEQFHNPKDLSLAISIEAAELNELFLWKAAEAADPARVKEELADVLAFSFLLADRYGFDIRQMVLDKLALNSIKYPVEKAKGNSTKYNQL
jgi:NTP pyrophosphatase (non-canonical NTP hydrolase)